MLGRDKFRYAACWFWHTAFIFDVLLARPTSRKSEIRLCWVLVVSSLHFRIQHKVGGMSVLGLATFFIKPISKLQYTCIPDAKAFPFNSLSNTMKL